MTRPPTRKTRRESTVKIREHLKRMRSALIHELARDVRGVQAGSSGDTRDSADLASEEVDRRLTITLSERGRGRITEIDDALRRLDEAKYGTCEECGLEVAEERLTAMPVTRYCRDCQGDRERNAKTRHSGKIGQLSFGDLRSDDEISDGYSRRAFPELTNTTQPKVGSDISDISE
jgi:DnaK suppressor protein